MPLICPICWSGLDDCATGVECVALSCGHVFHQACVQPWLQQNPTCAQCRAPATQTMKIFFSSTDLTESAELAYLQNRVQELTKEKEAAVRRAKDFSQSSEENEAFASTLLQELVSCQQANVGLNKRIADINRAKAELTLRLREAEQLAFQKDHQLQQVQREHEKCNQPNGHHSSDRDNKTTWTEESSLELEPQSCILPTITLTEQTDTSEEC